MLLIDRQVYRRSPRRGGPVPEPIVCQRPTLVLVRRLASARKKARKQTLIGVFHARHSDFWGFRFVYHSLDLLKTKLVASLVVSVCCDRHGTWPLGATLGAVHSTGPRDVDVQVPDRFRGDFVTLASPVPPVEVVSTTPPSRSCNVFGDVANNAARSICRRKVRSFGGPLLVARRFSSRGSCRSLPFRTGPAHRIE